MNLDIKSHEQVVLLAGPLTPNDGVIDSFVLGIFDSQKELAKGVDYWMKEHTNLVLHYKIVKVNATDLDPIQSWDWAYIPPNSAPESLGAGGGPVPTPNFWEKNLIRENWYHITCDYSWWEPDC